MALELIMRRSGQSLVPVDEAGFEDLDLIKSDFVLVLVKQERNLAFHRKFMALIRLIYQNQSRYTSVDELLDVIKVLVGHSRVAISPNGEEVHSPKSISFAKMSEPEFRAFFDKVVDAVCQHIIPGLQREDLEREILELIGIPYATP